MPPWLRIVLIVAGLFFVMTAAAGVGAYYWFKKHGRATLDAGRERMRDGEAFGRTATDDACLTRGLELAPAQAGFRSQMRGRLFTEGCLRTATRVPATCAGVPEPTQPFRIAAWAQARCLKLDRADQACAQLVQALPKHCHERAPSANNR